MEREATLPHLDSAKYEAPIKLGLEDPNQTVRDFTRRICSKLGISF